MNTDPVNLSTLTTADAPRWRILVQTDDSPEDPRDWGWVSTVGAHASSWRRRFTGEDTGPDTLRLSVALDRLRFHLEEDEDAASDAAIRWARIFHGRAVVYSPRMAALVYLEDPDTGDTPQADVLASFLDTWETWADGYVYGVTVQRAVTWHADEHDDRTDWEYVEAVWGNYLDDGYTARTVAEDMGVPADVAALLAVVEDF